MNESSSSRSYASSYEKGIKSKDKETNTINLTGLWLKLVLFLSCASRDFDDFFLPEANRTCVFGILTHQ